MTASRLSNEESSMHHPVPAKHPSTAHAPVSSAYAIFAGCCASLVAIGLARFAYTPLIPLLIGAHWFSAGDAVWPGAANFSGYFVGSLCGRALAARIGSRGALRAMMVLASLAFLACAWPLSLAWFFVWRFLSGLAGAVVMVLVAQAILPLVNPARRGMASGAIFMGIGAGIVASRLILPPLLERGLAACWIGLAALGGLLTLLTWRAWPAHAAQAVAAAAPRPAPAPRAVRLLYCAYAAVAAGLVPAAMFLVDFVARGLQQGAAHGARYWILYGVGAAAGPMLYGLVADRVGFGRALRLGLVCSGLASLLLAEWAHPAGLAAASLLLGAFTPGVVTLVIGRLHELLAHDHPAQHAAWSRSTTMFALSQALSGYAFSWLFVHGGGAYRPIFLAGAGAFALALLADLGVARAAARAPAQGQGRGPGRRG
jgi:predicted MFS family arabinose efflux permease